MVNDLTSIDALPSGDIVIEIRDGFGLIDIIFAEIEELQPIEIEGILSDYNLSLIHISEPTRPY